MIRFKTKLYNYNIYKYNDLIDRVESGQLVFERDAKLTLHHIIPRSVAPELAKDPSNHIWLPFYEHAMMHYWLWRYDKKYARQLWFIACYGRKNKLWDFPNGDEEYEQLKIDLRYATKV